MEFQGKVVLITGAGSGIGAATAEVFAKKGAALSLLDINGDWLKETEEKILPILANKNQLLLTVGNLGVDEVRENYVQKTLETFGKIDVLLNVAGIFLKDSAVEPDVRSLERILNVNVVAPYHLSTLCVPHLIKVKGCIVNVSSTVSDLAHAPSTSYAMSKAAIDSMTKSMALALGPHEVRVNSIRPGGIYTNIRSSHCGTKVPRDSLNPMVQCHALKRIGEASEVAEMMAIMASDKCLFMTGTNLLFDGGFNISRPEFPPIGPK